MLSRFDVCSELAREDSRKLVQVAAKYVMVPNQKVTDALANKAVFPAVRASKQRGLRGSVEDGIYRCDNTSPRYAILWPHGYRGVLRGWRVAHIWPNSGDDTCYTNVANLCLISAPLERLTDGKGPLLPYLKYHSQAAYGWRPKGEAEVVKPDGYDEIEWKELEVTGQPIDNLNNRFGKLNSHAIREYTKLDGINHWRSR